MGRGTDHSQHDFDVKKKKRKGSGKLRSQIEGLQSKLAEKKDDFDVASRQFDRVMEKMNHIDKNLITIMTMI